LPIPLTEAYFETSVPKPLVHDREVFMARMDTHHSRLYYTAKAFPPATTSPFSNHVEKASPRARRPINAAPSSFHAHRFTNAPQRQSSAPATANRSTRKRSASGGGGDVIYPLVLHVPRGLQSDVSVWCHVVHRHACVLVNATFVASVPTHLWQSRQFFTAVATGLRELVVWNAGGNHDLHRAHSLSVFSPVVARFLLELRNHAALFKYILESWPSGRGVASKTVAASVGLQQFEFIRLFLQPSETAPSANLDLQSVSESFVPLLRNDIDFALYIIHRVATALPNDALLAFAESVRHDWDVCLAAVTYNGATLEHVPRNFRRSVAMCRTAIQPRSCIVTCTLGDAILDECTLVCNSTRNHSMRNPPIRRNQY
jgi:hypothetical protein